MLALALVSLSLLTGVLGPAAAQDSRPSDARVSRTVRELSAVLGRTDEEAQITALQKARDVPHPAVIKIVARALEHEKRAIRTAAMQGLRWMEHPDAVEELLATHSRNKKLGRDEVEQFILLKAIGQHGDRRAIKLLTKNVFRSQNRDLSKACLLGLGMIREDASLEAFVKLLKGTDPRFLKRNADSMQLGLMMLTGVDKGRDPARWLTWWKSAKKGFKVEPTPPPLPNETIKRWNYFWNLRGKDPRPVRREDRGGSPQPAPAQR